MKQFKKSMLSWRSIVCLFVAILASACGGSDKTGETFTTKDGATVELNIKDPSAYIDAVNNQDFALAHQVLDKLYAKYLYKYGKDKYFSISHEDEKYWTAASHIYKAEMMWLLPQNDEDANKRVVFTLQNMNVIGEKPSTSRKYRGSQNYGPRAYMEFVQKYNALCSDILDISITNGNEEMARQIVRLFKDSYVPTKDEDDNVTYAIDSEERTAAEAKLQEAIAAGLFNE